MRASGRGERGSVATERRTPAYGQLLDAWDRYGKLLDDQLTALDGPRPDLDRFNRIAGDRARLAGEIDALRAGGGTGTATSADRAALRRLMMACGDRDRAVVGRLTRFRAERAGAIRTFEERKSGRDGYLTGGRTRGVGHRFDTTS